MITVPHRIKSLPSWGAMPIPFFVCWFQDGKPVRPGIGAPDFRVISIEAIRSCLQFRRCWICGHKLGSMVTFVVGPCSVLQQGSAEPGCHRECAEYAVKVCPYMANPDREERRAAVPAGTMTASEDHLPKGNPGVSATYVTRSWKVDAFVGNHVSLALGPPISVAWWRQGRPATRREVLVAMEGSIQQVIEAHGLGVIDALWPAFEAVLPPDVSRGAIVPHV